MKEVFRYHGAIFTVHLVAVIFQFRWFSCDRLDSRIPRHICAVFFLCALVSISTCLNCFCIFVYTPVVKALILGCAPSIL